MKLDFLENLSNVAQDVLRVTAFAFAEPCPMENLTIVESQMLRATISFGGNPSGNITLVACADLLETLGADILASDANSLAPVPLEDTLKELLNIICGQWLTTTYGEASVFNLGIPEVQSISAFPWNTFLNGSGSIGLMIDDVPILLTLSFANG
jgi:hypothetical protein